MKKILILNGSPREDGKTAQLVKIFKDAAKESGNEVCEEYINGLKINSCQGCDTCMKTHKGCVQEDEDMRRIYEELSWCDVIVFAPPVYYGYFSAQLKTVIDRMWAWFNLSGNARVKKETALISTARGADYSMIKTQYGLYSDFMGWMDLGCVLGAGREAEARKLGKSIF